MDPDVTAAFSKITGRLTPDPKRQHQTYDSTHSMRTPILLSATRAHSRLLPLTKPHHGAALINTALITPPHHHRYSSTTLPLNLTPSDLEYNKTLNPPPTTRPPPFLLPPSDPSLSLPRNLLAKGKAILTFYKTGLKSILLNRRLHSTPLPSLPGPVQALKPYPDTRAALLLASRLKHDLGRLIPLSLILLICAEFTPIVILWAPNLKLTPLTCRLPREVEAIRRRDQEERRAARKESKEEVEIVSGVLRVGRPRFVPGFLYPGLMLKSKVERRVAWIVADDAMLHQGGGQEELVWEEVQLAAEERGIDVLGREEKELRGVLVRWLDLTSRVEDLDEKRDLIKRMVVVGEEGWGELEEGLREKGQGSV